MANETAVHEEPSMDDSVIGNPSQARKWVRENIEGADETIDVNAIVNQKFQAHISELQGSPIAKAALKLLETKKDKKDAWSEEKDDMWKPGDPVRDTEEECTLIGLYVGSTPGKKYLEHYFLVPNPERKGKLQRRKVLGTEILTRKLANVEPMTPTRIQLLGYSRVEKGKLGDWDVKTLNDELS